MVNRAAETAAHLRDGLRPPRNSKFYFPERTLLLASAQPPAPRSARSTGGMIPGMTKKIAAVGLNLVLVHV
jgi:hypothetical protein